MFRLLAAARLPPSTLYLLHYNLHNLRLRAAADAAPDVAAPAVAAAAVTVIAK